MSGNVIIKTKAQLSVLLVHIRYGCITSTIRIRISLLSDLQLNACTTLSYSPLCFAAVCHKI